MRHNSRMIFDARKIYFFGLLIALLYGLSPNFSILFFGNTISEIGDFQFFFLVSFVVWGFLSFPLNNRFLVHLEVNEFRLLTSVALCLSAYVGVQIAVHGNFYTAFIIAYTERTGTALAGGLRYVVYPMTSAITVLISLLSIYVYTRVDRLNAITLSTLVMAIVIFGAIGSRNLLLWSFSGVLALFISRLRYGNIFLLVLGLYVSAVIFAYLRNNGFLLFLTGHIEHLYLPISFKYFDPIIHEFGSAFRTFSLLNNNEAIDQLNQAPYGIFSSFVLNQLPSYFKPTDFITMTNYISSQFAPVGEGIGSSPMTEINLSGGMSLLLLCTLAVFFYWPAYYLRWFPSLRFFSYSLIVAVSFNVWRIGSAEILKMFASNLVLLLLIGGAVGVRVLYFGKVR